MAGSTSRGTRLTALIALSGLVVWAVAGLAFFVFPTVDPVPRHADVVLVLGPPLPERLAVAERLLDDGIVGAALISVPYPSIPSDLQPLCARAHVTCFAPDPSTTRGEARMLRSEAARFGWTSAVVVTMPAHISRARTIVSRCFAGRLSMVADGEAPAGGWPYQYLYQTAATLKAWINQGC